MATSASTLHKCRVCKDEDHKKKKKLVIRFVPSVNGIDYGMFDSIAVAISPTTKLTVLWTHTGFLCSAFSLPRLISINFNVQEHMISNVSIERFTNKAVFLTSPQAYNMRWSICTIGFRSAKWKQQNFRISQYKHHTCSLVHAKQNIDFPQTFICFIQCPEANMFVLATQLG